MPSSWISRDKTKSYFGKEVTRKNGKITRVEEESSQDSSSSQGIPTKPSKNMILQFSQDRTKVRYYNPSTKAYTKWYSVKSGVPTNAPISKNYVTEAYEIKDGERVGKFSGKYQEPKKVYEVTGPHGEGYSTEEPEKTIEQVYYNTPKKGKLELAYEQKTGKSIYPSWLKTPVIEPKRVSYTGEVTTTDAFQKGDRVTSIEQAQKQIEREESPLRAGFFQPIEKWIGDTDKQAKKWTTEKNIIEEPVPAFSQTLGATGVGIGLGVLGLGVGMARTVAYPVKSAQSIVTVARDPSIISQEIIRYGDEHSVGYAAGQVAGMYLMGKAIRGVYRRSPVKARVSKLTIEGVEPYKGVELQLGRKSYNIIGTTPKYVTFGSPKLTYSYSELPSSFIVETGGQTTILKKTFGSSFKVGELDKFSSGLKLMKYTEKVNTPRSVLRKGFINEVKYLSPKQSQQVLTFVKREKGLLYGSYPSRSQIPESIWTKYRGSNIPADIDVQLNYNAETTALKTKNLLGKLNKVSGYEVRISSKSPTLIEAKVKGSWHHAVDIHSIDTPMKEIYSPAVGQEGAYGFSFNQKPYSIEGIKAMRLSEQGLRKGASIFTVRKSSQELILGPEPHRIKDIGDFFATQEALVQYKLLGKGKASAELSSIKSLYSGESLATSQTKSLIYSPKVYDLPSQFNLISPSFSVSKSKSSSPKMSASRSPYSYSISSLSPSFSVSDSVSVSPSSSKSPSFSISLGNYPSFFGSSSLSPYPSPPSFPVPSPSPPPSTPSFPVPSPSPPPSTPNFPIPSPPSPYLNFGDNEKKKYKKEKLKSNLYYKKINIPKMLFG